MPIKKLRVSFDIDAEMFARMLAAGHNEMNIEVFGAEDPRVSHTQLPVVVDRSGMRNIILKALKDREKLTPFKIRKILTGAGYSVKSLNGCLHNMKQDGLVRRAGYGIYMITTKGLSHVQE